MSTSEVTTTALDVISKLFGIAALIDPALVPVQTAINLIDNAQHSPAVAKAEDGIAAAIMGALTRHNVTPAQVATAAVRAQTVLASAISDQDRAMWARADLERQ